MPLFGGWSCAPAHKANFGVTGKLGYLGYPRALVFEQGSFAGVAIRQVTVPVQGLWVGASATAGSFVAYEPGEGLCFSVGASWLFPNNKEAVETASVPVIGVGYENWRTSTQWYTLEASVSRCLGGTFSLIGGFRYDNFSTKLSDPFESQNFIIDLQDEGELTFSSYIPYVGAISRWGAVEVGVIGFPYIPGNILFKKGFGGPINHVEAVGNYRNGYFLEAFLDVGRQMGLVHLSGFATYTVLHATGIGDLYISSTAQVAAVGDPPPTFTVGLDRQNWIVGGKAVLGFNSPL